jgi:TonB family protein
MTDFLIYDLKVAVLIAVFYMFYRLMLARETFHRVNRIVLLATAVASFILPLCVITTHQTVMMPMPTVDVELGATVIEDDAPQVPLWQMILPILYILGMVATLANTLWSVFRITSLIKHSEQHPQDDGTMICVTGNAALAPFSWMHYIVMNRSDYETNDAAILTHERGHIRLRHSWDLILVDLLTALQWFNPAMWMLRSDLRAIHEYEADGAVLSQGINARQYQYLLITKAGGIGGYSLANGITHSALKNRIHMMLHTKSPRRSLLKLLALVPIVGVTLALNAETVTDYVYNNDEPQKQVPVKKGRKAGTIKAGNGTVLQVVEQKVDDRIEPAAGLKVIQTEAGKKPLFIVDGVRMDEKQATAIAPNEISSMTVLKDKAAIDLYGQDAKDGVIVITRKKNATGEASDVFDVVETMPEFPGGAPKLFEYLSQNIRYPKEAMEANKQGRVIVTFVVGKDGSIRDARVVKSVDPLLDAEGLRVISTMPNWTPGTQSGKAVNVKYTVPISFRLDGGKPKETTQATVSFTPLKLDASDPKFKEVVSRLPGAKIDENGNVTINGKPVKKILVDGKPVEDKSKLITPQNVKTDGDGLIIIKVN